MGKVGEAHAQGGGGTRGVVCTYAGGCVHMRRGTRGLRAHCIMGAGVCVCAVAHTCARFRHETTKSLAITGLDQNGLQPCKSLHFPSLPIKAKVALGMGEIRSKKAAQGGRVINPFLS